MLEALEELTNFRLKKDSEDGNILVDLRAILYKRNVNIMKEIKRLSSRLCIVDEKEVREEMHRKEGELKGLGYALKVLDKMCQTDLETFIK